jgi:hypothetical protein
MQSRSCLPRKSHHKLLSTDECKVTFYVDAMSWNDITPSLCLHIQKLELTIDKNKLPKFSKTFVLLTLILANDIHYGEDNTKLKNLCLILLSLFRQ